MPFPIPTLTQLITLAQTDLGGVKRKSVEFAIARMSANATKGLYSFLGWCLDQCFPDTAEPTYFWRWAGTFGIFQKSPTQWQGTYIFTGGASASVPAGTELHRSDGVLYTTTAAASITAGVGTAPILASDPGAASNSAPDQILSLSAPIAGVDTDGIVQSTTVAGADAETPAAGLSRLLLRLRTPPAGGGPHDYERWALECPGVTRAWEFANLDEQNSVSVAFARDLDGPGAAAVPDAGERAVVLAYLQAHAPITVTPKVLATVATPVDVTIQGLVPDTVATRNAIAASIQDLIAREGVPRGLLARSRLDEAISVAAGESSHVLVAPASDLTFTALQMPVLGTFTVLP